MNNSRVVHWVPMYPDPVVWVSVKKLDASWRRDISYYVGRGVTGPGNGRPSRYKRLGEWLTATDVIWMPHVGLVDAIISFSDGRHRFAWLRDHGVRSLPVTVSPQIEAEMKRLFGTKSRESRFVSNQVEIVILHSDF